MSGEPTLLLTGFEPFGGETVNPSQRIAETYESAELFQLGTCIRCAR